MSIFNRVAGIEESKIPVWPLMVDFTRVLDNDLSLADFVIKYNLSTAEQTEANQYFAAIGSMIQAEVQARMNIGFPQDLAIRDARTSIDAVLRYALLRCEHGTITEAAFRTSLGL